MKINGSRIIGLTSKVNSLLKSDFNLYLRSSGSIPKQGTSIPKLPIKVNGFILEVTEFQKSEI